MSIVIDIYICYRSTIVTKLVHTSHPSYVPVHVSTYSYNVSICAFICALSTSSWLIISCLCQLSYATILFCISIFLPMSLSMFPSICLPMYVFISVSAF